MTAAQLREAIEIARSGRKKEAQVLLQQILEQEPENEVAYFWYVDTLSSDDERARMLKNFLASHPNHEKAKVALRSIQVRLEARGGMLPETTVQKAQTPPPVSAQPPETVAEVPEIVKVTSPEPESAPTGGAKKVEPVTAEVKEPVVEKEVKGQPSREGVVDVVAVPVPAPAKPKSQHPGPEDFSPPYQKLAPAKKEKNTVVTAITIVVVILLVVACAIYALVKGVLQNPAFQSPEKQYATEMSDAMEKLSDWINGPITEWGTAMSEDVYEGSSYQEVFQMNQQMGYVDVLVADKLLPIANDIGMGGLRIDNAMSQITPPAQIETAHYQVLLCVRYERTWAEAIIGFLERNEPIEVEESPCGNFLESYRQLVSFVEANK